jgi:NAD(P)-dependent dehydrogenase (short-subunit alcohol dehydrogenase family)
VPAAAAVVLALAVLRKPDDCLTIHVHTRLVSSLTTLVAETNPSNKERRTMTAITSGTVLITGPTGGLGRAAALAMANRPAPVRPDLLLVGRGGRAPTEVAEAARAAGASAYEIDCDLAQLADVRVAAQKTKELLASRSVRPLRGVVANAGVSVVDTRSASADGYEMTFAVNHLAHAQLIGPLLGSFVAPARIVLLGSNTYHQNFFRRMLHVQPADWRDPIELAQPTAPHVPATLTGAGVAYSNSKLAILYYAHELQRRAPGGSTSWCSSRDSCPAPGCREGTAPGFRG